MSQNNKWLVGFEWRCESFVVCPLSEKKTFLDAAAFAGSQTASNGKRPVNVPADGASVLTSPTAPIVASSSSVGGNRSRPATQSGNNSAIKESADSNSATIDDVNDLERVDRLSKSMWSDDEEKTPREDETNQQIEDRCC